MFTCASINVFEYFRRIFPRTQLCSSYKNNYLWSLELLSNWKIKSAAPALIDGSETINYRGENGRKYIKAKTHFSCHVSFKSFFVPPFCYRSLSLQKMATLSAYVNLTNTTGTSFTCVICLWKDVVRLDYFYPFQSMWMFFFPKFYCLPGDGLPKTFS